MLWSTKRVAQEKGVTAMTVRNAIHRGDLPAVVVEGIGERIVSHGIRPQDAKDWMPGRKGKKASAVDAVG